MNRGGKGWVAVLNHEVLCNISITSRNERHGGRGSIIDAPPRVFRYSGWLLKTSMFLKNIRSGGATTCEYVHVLSEGAGLILTKHEQKKKGQMKVELGNYVKIRTGNALLPH